MSNFVIDIGNTRIKSAEFVDQEIKNIEKWTSVDDLFSFIPENACVIISSTAKKETGSKLLSLPHSMRFDHDTEIPISLDYKTPETLGLDRIAAAVGAYQLFGGPSLIIDLGTCITYDLVDGEGVFRGGAIAPGFYMRMRSMHEFTANLPDIRRDWETNDAGFPGKSTVECMVSGTKQAITNEIQSFIDESNKEFGKINVILTGGDSPFFESNIKAPIFVRPNLVLRGLNEILIYNEVN